MTDRQGEAIDTSLPRFHDEPSELVLEVKRTAAVAAGLFRELEEMKAQRDDLMKACREAETGLESAVTHGCECYRQSVCDGHLALAIVQMALVKAGA